MIQAFKKSGLAPTDRLVAFMLADHHNDSTGRCDPSIPLLAEETGLHPRSVERAIQAIEKQGHVTVIRKAGVRHTYSLHPRQSAAGDSVPPAADSRPTPGTESGAPPAERRDTPGTESLEPERTVSKPEENRKKEARARKPCRRQQFLDAGKETTRTALVPDSLQTPQFQSEWLAFCAQREEMSTSDKTAWTPRAATSTLRELEELGPAWAVIELRKSVSNNWRGVHPDQRRNPADVRSQPLLPTNGSKNEPPESRFGPIEPNKWKS